MGSGNKWGQSHLIGCLIANAKLIPPLWRKAWLFGRGKALPLSPLYPFAPAAVFPGATAVTFRG